MAKCILCNEDILFFKAKRWPGCNGKCLCASCLKKLPQTFFPGGRLVHQEQIDSAIEYRRSVLNSGIGRVFKASYRYGAMALDEIHELVAITSAVNADGRLDEDVTDVFRLNDLYNEEFYLETGKRENNSSIMVTAWFTAYIRFNGMRIRTALSNDLAILIADGDSLYMQDPSELKCLKATYGQMVEQYNERLKAKQHEDKVEIRYIRSEVDELEKARALYMLGSEYTHEDIRRQRAILLKAFHPDSANVETGEYVSKINYAYDLLVKSIQII